MASSIEAIQKILQETVAPGISDLRERLTRVEVEIKRLDDKMDNGFKRLDDRIESLRNETSSEFRRLDARMDSLDRRLDESASIRERLAALEAKVAAH